MLPSQILVNIIDNYKSIREFSRTIGEDPADVFRWKSGKRAINPRAVVSICKIYPKVKPYELNPDIFEEGLTFHFK